MPDRRPRGAGAGARPVDEAVVDAVLGALSDATRRAVLAEVARVGPVTATTLAADLPVTRQAVAKHLDRLADAGLVHAERVGRETRWRVTPGPLGAARAWMDQVGAAWDRRLGALAERAGRLDPPEP